MDFSIRILKKAEAASVCRKAENTFPGPCHKKTAVSQRKPQYLWST